MELIRKKVQVFEEVDIDRISEFVTMTSDEQDNQVILDEHNQDLSIEPDSTIARMINVAAS